MQEPRFSALIIGNAEYEHATHLGNPLNDADDMTIKLADLGFETVTLKNASHGVMRSALITFAEALKDSSVGLFFFAGHAFQLSGENYLAGIDTSVSSDYAVEQTAVTLSTVLRAMKHGSVRTGLIILDACRNNPFEGLGTSRGMSDDLAPVSAPKGTLIAFSTSPGQKAKDGDGGRNGRYTEALLKHIDAPDIPIETMFKRVRSTLDQLTNGGQMSWEHTSLIGDFRFQRRAAPGAERYATMALSDSLYPRTATAAGRLIEALKSYDWYTQNPALHSFSQADAAASSNDELFIVGRNIYQAACGSANEATAYVSQFKQRTATLDKEQRKALLDGMLYEIFFNSLGEHRARPKLEAFSSVFRMVTDDDVIESFVFIRKSLEPYATRYHVLPGSREVVDVTISGDPTTRAGEYIVNGIWLGSTNVLREIEDEEPVPYVNPEIRKGMMLGSFREFLSEQLVVPIELLNVTPAFNYTGGTTFKVPYTHTVVTSQT